MSDRLLLTVDFSNGCIAGMDGAVLVVSTSPSELKTFTEVAPWLKLFEEFEVCLRSKLSNHLDSAGQGSWAVRGGFATGDSDGLESRSQRQLRETRDDRRQR